MNQITNKLNKGLRLLMLAWVGVLLATLPVACSDKDDEVLSSTGGMAIDLVVTAPDDGATMTRAKSSFTDGDIIWVKATFTGTAETERNKMYKLKLSGGKWIVDGTYGEFSWPQDATGGSFEAYFIGNTEFVVGNTLTIPFRDITDEEGKDDPLYAKTGEIAAGGAVHLLFAHTLTKLYVDGLDKKAEVNVALGGISSALMTFSDAGYEISGVKADLMSQAQDGKAVFFLHVLANKDPALSINGVDIELRANIKTNMKAMKPGHAYYLDYGAGGANMNLIELDNWWKEPAGCVPPLQLTTSQINELFNALRNGQAYGITSTQEEQIGWKDILDATGKLLICLNFQNNSFTVGELTNSLNGDYHTIYNVASECGLFTTIKSGASIQHLTLSDVTITQSTSAKIGVIAGTNEGQLTDVHLKGISVIQGNNATHIGGLIGENKASLNGLSVSGQLDLAHALAGSNDFYIGGLIGSSEATLTRCIVSGAVKITTTGTTTQDARIGGLVGACRAMADEPAADAASVNHCVANTQIDASGAEAANLYVGGFAGSILCRIADCSASGQTIGGTGTASAATGGFAGYINHQNNDLYPNACSATGDVQASATKGNCYTGGLVGQSVISLKNCYSVGKVTMSRLVTNQFTGGLIGMIAADKLIYNSFSMSQLYNADKAPIDVVLTIDDNITNDARLCGLRPEAKTRNCHYQGWLLNTKGGNDSPGVKASYLNASVNASNQYLRWNSVANVYGGAPYLLYQQRP